MCTLILRVAGVLVLAQCCKARSMQLGFPTPDLVFAAIYVDASKKAPRSMPGRDCTFPGVVQVVYATVLAVDFLIPADPDYVNAEHTKAWAPHSYRLLEVESMVLVTVTPETVGPVPLLPLRLDA